MATAFCVICGRMVGITPHIRYYVHNRTDGRGMPLERCPGSGRVVADVDRVETAVLTTDLL